jgi:hypothetical protein
VASIVTPSDAKTLLAPRQAWRTGSGYGKVAANCL